MLQSLRLIEEAESGNLSVLKQEKWLQFLFYNEKFEPCQLPDSTCVVVVEK